MPQHYQVIIKDDGKVYINTLDGSQRIDPDKTAEIAAKLAATAQEPSYVYIGYQASTNRHKIGLSVEPPRRAKELDIEIFHTIKCKAWGDHSARALEKLMHTFFKLVGQHIEGEWFNLTEFDLWDIKDTDDNDFHHNYKIIIDAVKELQDNFEPGTFPDPFVTQRDFTKNFWKMPNGNQFGFIYFFHWATLQAEKSQEKVLAGFMRNWIDGLRRYYMAEMKKKNAAQK